MAEFPHSVGKTRNWTREEVDTAVARLKAERPEVWKELERLEATTGDLNGSDAIMIQGGLLRQMYPDCNIYDLIQLEFEVRNVRRTDLGLSWDA